METTDWITTASGLQFYPLTPRMGDIHLGDIAHALAAVNRFNGHTREPYSVAQHSVLVSVEMEEAAAHAPDAVAWAWGLYGLLHDASEAYLCDVPRPLKQLKAFAPYREAERWLQLAVYAAFGLDPLEPAALKLIDLRMLRTEQRDLMPPAAPGEDRSDAAPFAMAIEPWPWPAARTAFLRRWLHLDAQRADAARAAVLGA